MPLLSDLEKLCKDLMRYRKLFGLDGVENILVIDSGLCVEQALRLKDDYNVKYTTIWQAEGFPHFDSYAPGLGLLDKAEFFEDIDWADLVVFFDNGWGNLIEYLRDQGKPCFGAGLAEELELKRERAIEIQDEYNIPYPKSYTLKGIDELENFLKNNQNVFVKLDKFRGSSETFFHQNFDDSTEVKLAELRTEFGPFADDMIFICQEKEEGVEGGYDFFFNGSNYQKPYLYGYEIKGTGVYVGKLSDTIPDAYTEVAEKIKPYLAMMGYKGAISTEGIVGKERKLKMIDWTARIPMPLGALFTLWDNFPELVVKTALGEDCMIKSSYQYFASLALESPKAEENWLALNIPENLRRNIKGRIVSKSKENYWAVPGFSSVLIIISEGDTYQEALENIFNITESLNYVEELDLANTSALEKVEDIIEEGEKYGINF